MYVCTYVHVHVHIHIYIYTYIHIYTYIYTYRHTCIHTIMLSQVACVGGFHAWASGSPPVGLCVESLGFMLERFGVIGLKFQGLGFRGIGFRVQGSEFRFL